MPAGFPGDLQSELRFGTQNSPASIAVGDLNGDGKLDMVIANADNGSIGIYLGKGDGTFAAPSFITLATGSFPFGIALADLDSDGKLDIIEADYNITNLTFGGVVRVLLGNGDGTFKTATDYVAGKNLTALAVGDFDHDGHPDVAAVDNTSGAVSVLLNDGTGKLQAAVVYPVALGSYSIAVADLNGDAKLDLVVSNACNLSGSNPFSCQIGMSSPNNVSVLLGNGDGTFKTAVPYPAGPTPFKIAVADFNGDGHPDVAVTNNVSNSVAVLLGKGDGTFNPFVAYPVGPSPRDITAGDFNGDGRIDLVVGLTELLGNGDGTFESPVYYFVQTQTGAVFSADLNSDGHPDLLVVTTNVSLGVFLNAFGLKRTSTTTIVTAAPNPSVLNAAAIITAAVSSNGGPTPGGSVTFYVNGQAVLNPSAGVLDSTGHAQLQLTNMTAGTFKVAAIYSGDTLTQGSVSPAINVEIDRIPTTTNLLSSVNPATAGQQITFTAVAFASSDIFDTNTTFSFFDGSTLLATVSSAMNSFGKLQGTLTVTNLAVGTHPISAAFSGDTTFALSTSQVLNQQIFATPLPISMNSPGSVTITAGQPATYKLTLVSAGFAGHVELTCLGAPAHSTCSLNPFSGDLNFGSTLPITATVSTQAHSVSMFDIGHPPKTLLGVLVAGVFLLSLCVVRLQRKTLRIGLAFAGMLFLITVIGCGGGSSSPGNMSGTPAGTYTIVVTASSGSISNTQNLTLVVQ